MRFLIVAACACSLAAQAADKLDTVIVIGHYENGVGTSDAASAGTVTAKLLENRPALRPGEVLEFVPGVIVTQHSGDGKANQYFCTCGNCSDDEIKQAVIYTVKQSQ